MITAEAAVGNNFMSENGKMWEDELAERIKRGLLLCQAQRGLDRAEISRRLGFETESSLSKWAKGQATPGPENIAKLCDATGLSPAYLLLGQKPAFQGDRDMQVEVIGRVVDGDISAEAVKLFVQAVAERDKDADPASSQVEFARFVREGRWPVVPPEENDGSTHNDPPGDPPTDKKSG